MEINKWTRSWVFILFQIGLAIILGPAPNAKAGLFHPSRENACWQAIKAVRKNSHLANGVSQYTLNSFASLRDQLTTPIIQPGLESGYAFIAGNKVESGSLKENKVSARLHAILELVKGKPDKTLVTSGRTIAFSLKDPDLINEFFQDHQSLLNGAMGFQRKGFFVHALVSFFAFSGYYFVGSEFLESPDFFNLSLLVLHSFFTGGLEGIKKAGTFYRTVGDQINEMRAFMETPNSSGRREFFLISHSARLPKRLSEIENSRMSLIAQLDEETIHRMEQFLIWSEKAPIGQRKFKPEYAHADFLIEKDPQSNLEAHFLVQFTEDPPRFSRRKKKKLEERKKAPSFLNPLANPA